MIDKPDEYEKRQWFGLLGGIALFALTLFLPLGIDSPEAHRTLAVTVLMATWWITEAIPIPVVSLVPVALFPVLGIMDSSKVTLQYADSIV
ncbi:MAG: anion permease, partial [Candidatus Bipolaricaulota bacterium]